MITVAENMAKIVMMAKSVGGEEEVLIVIIMGHMLRGIRNNRQAKGQQCQHTIWFSQLKPL